MGSEQKYKQLGADYHWQWARGGDSNPYVRWVKRVLAHIPSDGQGARVADYGCGDGYPASLLIERGYEIVGVDVIEAALDVARQRVPGGAFFLPEAGVIHSGAYVVALDSIEHMVDPTSLVEAVRQCTRYALVSCPAPGLDPHAVRDYTAGDLRALFAGCVVETLIDEGEHRLFKVTPGQKGPEDEDRGDRVAKGKAGTGDDQRSQRQPVRSGKRTRRARA